MMTHPYLIENTEHGTEGAIETLIEITYTPQKGQSVSPCAYNSSDGILVVLTGDHIYDTILMIANEKRRMKSRLL